MKYRGRVKYISKDRSYGYICTQSKEIGEDIYFIPSSETEKDQTLEFEIEKGYSRYRAVNIEVIDRNKSKFNTEDKSKWCKEGADLEIVFIKQDVPKLKRNIVINPKKKYNPCHIDLLDIDNNREADLKTQQTPFFTAAVRDKRYDPTYTVTFNKKDYENYKNNYDENIDIYWKIKWIQLEWKSFKVEPLDGLWVAKFKDMAKAIENNKVYLHEYQNRKNDDKNARDSYLFDLRDTSIFTKLL